MPRPPFVDGYRPGEGGSCRKDAGLDTAAPCNLRLPLELLELALQELERHGREDTLGQAGGSLLRFGSRLCDLAKGSASVPPTGEAWPEKAGRMVKPNLAETGDALARNLKSGAGMSMSHHGQSMKNIASPELDSPSHQKLVIEPRTMSDLHTLSDAKWILNSDVLHSESRMKRAEAMSARQGRKHKVRELMNLFSRLDIDGNGIVGADELIVTLEKLGMSRKDIRRFVRKADASGDGLIHREEFLRALDTPEATALFSNVASFRYADLAQKENRFMLRQSSAARVCWDLACCGMLLCVAGVEPVLLAFPSIGERPTFRVLSVIIEIFFLSDVVLNFRTGFFTIDGFEVMDPWAVAKHYLKTWFTLDLLSALPLNTLTASNVGDQKPLRLLKYWKLVRVMKFMKLSMAFKTFRKVITSSIAMDLNDWLHMTRLFNYLPLIYLLMVTVVVCHWLACFMVATGDGFLGDYQDVRGHVAAEYVAGLYWAATTISTVGYGDITPGSTSERLYSILAMIVGGSFYGYVIAKVTSIVTRVELCDQVYQDKLNEVYSWLRFHQFPRELRKRTRQYFKHYLKLKTNLDDATILSCLSPELRSEISEYMVSTEVRNLPIFADVPAGFISLLPKILQYCKVEAFERIVQRGAVGSAMYIISAGEVLLQFGDKGEDPVHAHSLSANDALLQAGDSFGEELLVNPGGLYNYTAIAQTRVDMKVLPMVTFKEEFTRFPAVFEQVLRNTEILRREGGLSARWPSQKGA